MSGSDVLLEVEDLHTAYTVRSGILGRRRGEVEAVAGVSLRVHRGETLSVVGESGCGKTTLARTLLRLVPARAGRVRFDGRDVLALEGAGLRALRRRVQVVFQDPLGSLNPRFTVGRTLAEVLSVHGITVPGAATRERVAALLRQVGLDVEHARRLPHELSGGQRQRVGIARALAMEPELLILDEPVSALDVSVRAQVVNLLVDLQRELCLTYLLIAHDLALVEHVSDRVAVMYQGRIVEEATVPELYGDPRHPYTRELLSAIPQPVVPEPGAPAEGGPTPRVETPGQGEGPSGPVKGCPYRLRCGHPRKDEECARGVPWLAPVSDTHFVACVKESSNLRTGG